MLRIRKVVPFSMMGVKEPWYWGFSYIDYISAHSVLYIIPINWIVWIVREIYYKLRFTPSSYTDKAYQKGYSDGISRKERGQSLVELAISFAILMYLLSGAVEFGIAFFQFVQLRDAAQEGALYGSINPTDTVSIENRVRGASSSPIDLSSSDVQVEILYGQTQVCEGNFIKVIVSYPHKIFMPFLPQILGTRVLNLRGEVTDTILRPICK